LKVRILVTNYIVVFDYLGQCLGGEYCVGIFYQTYMDWYYGRYQVTTDYSHRYYYYYSYQHGPKYCANRCCTLSVGYTTTYYSNSYKTCCADFGDIPSYKSSDKKSSTIGIIVGCTIGGSLFTFIVVFLLCVAHCVSKEKKRIDPAAIECGSVTMKDNPVVVADSPITQTTADATSTTKDTVSIV
ncbi:uncharacterized protein LOC132549582, partial [Ylistrum balloti]|uniref:uncharacterized protein LOC132549582 n=1 Tax=Ylistrum balloti TaxID=509963 RepID=UPI002905AF1C